MIFSGNFNQSVRNMLVKNVYFEFTQNKNVVVSVTDYGNGIDESLQTKIFNPNFTTKSSGTGLGLAICKAIVDNADGKIWFATSPGEGTTFYVKLPLAV